MVEIHNHVFTFEGDHSRKYLDGAAPLRKYLNLTVDHTQPNNADFKNCHLPVVRDSIESLKNIIFNLIIHSACKITELCLCHGAKAVFLLNIFDATFNFLNEQLYVADQK